jgi:hypothetical protein
MHEGLSLAKGIAPCGLSLQKQLDKAHTATLHGCPSSLSPSISMLVYVVLSAKACLLR